MSTQTLSTEVSELIKSLNHPFVNEIEYLRALILSCNVKLSENVKWNGPNYTYQEIDCITMRVQPVKKQLQLIFHRGAKKLPQPIEKFITNNSKLLTWKENDRAIVSFNSIDELKDAKIKLTEIIKEWLHNVEMSI